MVKLRTHFLILFCLLLIAFNGTLTNAQSLYTLTSLGQVQPSDINDSGNIVGQISNTSEAFLYSNGNFFILSGTASAAYGLNNAGQSVGYSGSPSHATLYDSGAVIGLGTLGGTNSFGNAINDLGQIVGYAYTHTGIEHAYLFSNGAMTDLGTFGGLRSFAYGINNSGQIAGTAQYASPANIYRAFIYNN